MSTADIADYIVDIPQEVVVAIAVAAVDTYKQKMRDKANAEQRARMAANRDAILRRRAELREDARLGIHIPRTRRKAGAEN